MLTRLAGPRLAHSSPKAAITPRLSRSSRGQCHTLSPLVVTQLPVPRSAGEEPEANGRSRTEWGGAGGEGGRDERGGVCARG